MSPSRRYEGTLPRIRAVLRHRPLYEIGREFDVPSDIGRPRVQPPYVLLIFATLARIARSTIRVEEDLQDRDLWRLVRTEIIETLQREHLDLPAPSSTPPAWHHWRRFRDEHLTSDEGLARLSHLHVAHAVTLARSNGLGVPNSAVEATLRVVIAEAGPCRVRLAAGHPHSTRYAQRVCLELGVDVLRAKPRRNAADRALLGAALSLRGDGVTRFVVCSHDADLAAVPGRYRVIATGRGVVGRKLAQRAESVTTIDVGGTATTVAAVRAARGGSPVLMAAGTSRPVGD